MFSILISADETAWEKPGRFSIGFDRFLEHSGEEAVARLPKTDPRTLQALERMYTFLAYETMISSAERAIVRFGTVRDVRVEGRLISFQFVEKGHMSRTDFEESAARLHLTNWELSRTHWAVKDGEVPGDVYAKIAETPRRYDVVLSFAGEDRAYVERVAGYLASSSVEVFYDRYEEATLWGKDLAEHLDVIYSRRARYCVMFVSKHYAEKLWTVHERRSVLERALQEKGGEYILPVRFDDTQIPGLRSTLGYIDLRTKTPEQLAALIMQKLGRARF